MTLRFKNTEEAAAWLGEAANARKSPDQSRAEWYKAGRDAIEARGERVTTESLRAELSKDKPRGRELKVFEGEAKDSDVIAAIAVAGFNQAIANGLQGLIDAANGPGNYERESLPHYDAIEAAAGRAGYAIESTFPWYMRKRRAAVWACFLLVGAAGIVVALWL